MHIYTIFTTNFIKINKSRMAGIMCSPSFIHRVIVKTAMNNGINQQ
jgi:hypothetical protein